MLYSLSLDKHRSVTVIRVKYMSYTKWYRSHQNNSPCWNNIDYKWSHCFSSCKPTCGRRRTVWDGYASLDVLLLLRHQINGEQVWVLWIYFIFTIMTQFVSWQPCESQYFIFALYHCRFTEFADHLHEHFVDPVVVKNGCYQASSVSNYPSFIV